MLLSFLAQAALLEPKVFGEIRRNDSSFIYALVAVIGAAVAFGIGIGAKLQTLETPPAQPVVIAIVSVLLGWAIWTFVNYFIGSKMLGGKATYREVLHALGICYAPGILMVTIAIPVIGMITFSFSTFWILSAGIIAMSETQQVSIRKILLPTIIGWLPVAWLTWVLIVNL